MLKLNFVNSLILSIAALIYAAPQELVKYNWPLKVQAPFIDVNFTLSMPNASSGTITCFAAQAEIDKIRMAKTYLSKLPDGQSLTIDFNRQHELAGYYLVHFIHDNQFKENMGFIAIASKINGIIFEEIKGDVPSIQQMIAALKTYQKVSCNKKILTNISDDQTRILQKCLETNGISYEVIVQCTDSSTSSYAAIMKFGNYTVAYAMYGIWNNANALKYKSENGQIFRPGDRVYMSDNIPYAAQPTPNMQLALNNNLSPTDESSAGLGVKVWTYEEARADLNENKNIITPYLAWRSEPLNSVTPQRLYTEEGEQKPTPKGNFAPIGPDEKPNSNPPVIADCPDKDYYWTLFCDCAAEQLKPITDKEMPASDFSDYKDYLGVNMMNGTYDATDYASDGGINPSIITSENPPVEPELYNKKCDLINGDLPKFYDPFDSKTMYYLVQPFFKVPQGTAQWVAYPGIVNSLIVTANALGYLIHYGSVAPLYPILWNFTDEVKPVLRTVVSHFDSYLKNATYQQLQEFVRTHAEWSLNYTGENDTNLIKYKYVVYLANPVDHFRAFKNSRQFLIYDNYSQINGEPFSVECSPDYEAGTDRRDAKKWYIRWEWPLYYKDRFDIKHSAGTLTCKYKFYDEPKHSMAKKILEVKIDGLLATDWHSFEDDADLTIGTADRLSPAGEKWSFNKTATEEMCFAPSKDPTKWADEIMISDYHSIDYWTDQKERNIHLYCVGDTANKIPGMAGYNKNSKEYRTDQTDVADRDDDEFDKGEAIREIIVKIAVAEGLNLVMKGIYKLGKERDDYVGNASKAVYEAGKSLENSLTQSKTYQIAKTLYKGYCFWKQTIDILRELRDTYNSIAQAWDGLMSSARSIVDYYEDYDWKKLRLTNCSSLIPYSQICDVNVALWDVQRKVNNFALAVDALAFQTDRLTAGNYGPLNPLIINVSNALAQSEYISGTDATKIIENNSKLVDGVLQSSGRDISHQAYLSNITATAQTAISSQNITIQNQMLKASASALYLLESESRDWVTYANYMSTLPQNLDKATQASQKEKSLYPLVWALRTPNVFPARSSIVLDRLVEKGEIK